MPATTATPPRRQRLAPQARADQILDVAARLLLAEGFTEVSMERLGREVYNYFPNRNDLLRALLEREMGLLRENQSAHVRAAESFEDLVRRTTRLYIDNMKARGPLLRKLWAEPAVAGSLAGENQRERDKAMQYLARRVVKEYLLPQDVALSAVDMSMAMTEAAAQHLSQSHDDVDFATDICVTLLLGGLDALAKRHAKAQAAAARVAKAAKAGRVAAGVKRRVKG
jgi:TetR/AcrR family transcriptional regulator, fatty acid biosynthesis regulator